MGYLLLFIAVFAGIMKGFCGKKTSFAVSDLKDAMLANALRMLLCIVIGFAVVSLEGSIKSLIISNEVLWISALSGISTSVFVVSWLLSVKRGAYMMLDVFLMLGTVIPLFASSVIFGEMILAKQVIGLVILIVSVIIMCSYNNSIKKKISIGSLALLILGGAAGGISDFSQKLFIESNSGYSSAVFNFYTYVFSALALVFCYLVMEVKNKDSNVASFVKIKSVFGYILVMSLCLFLNSYFKTLSAGYLPAAQIYPLAQGSSMILSSFMAAALFGEKLTLKSVVGIMIAFVGLLFINVL